LSFHVAPFRVKQCPARCAGLVWIPTRAVFKDDALHFAFDLRCTFFHTFVNIVGLAFFNRLLMGLDDVLPEEGLGGCFPFLVNGLDLDIYLTDRFIGVDFDAIRKMRLVRRQAETGELNWSPIRLRAGIRRGR